MSILWVSEYHGSRKNRQYNWREADGVLTILLCFFCLCCVLCLCCGFFGLCCVFLSLFPCRCQTLHRVPVVVPRCSSTSCVPFSLSHSALKEEQQQLSKRTQVSVMVPLDLTDELCNQIVVSLKKDEMAGTKHPSSDDEEERKPG